MSDKKSITVYVSESEYKRFKDLQALFKKKGHDMSALFREILDCYDKLKGGF